MYTLTDSGSLIKDLIILRTPIFGNLVLQNLLSKFSNFLTCGPCVKKSDSKTSLTDSISSFVISCLPYGIIRIKANTSLFDYRI